MSRAPKAFGTVLRNLMDERDVSFRELAKLTGHPAKGYSSGYLNQLTRDDENLPVGDEKIIETAETVARALGEDPSVFAEYRLAVHRRRFDPRSVGLARALRNLEADGA
jgi:hypothetical protein